MENTLIIVGYVNNMGLFREDTKKVYMEPTLSESQKSELAIEIVEEDLEIDDYNYVLHTGIQ